MRNILKSIGLAAGVGAMALVAVTPANAAGFPWWGPHRHSYHHYYSPGGYYGPWGYSGYDPGAAVTAGLIGGIFGAIAGTALHAGGGGHVWRCEHRYHSYARGSDSFVGNDGARHACTL